MKPYTLGAAFIALAFCSVLLTACDSGPEYLDGQGSKSAGSAPAASER